MECLNCKAPISNTGNNKLCADCSVKFDRAVASAQTEAEPEKLTYRPKANQAQDSLTLSQPSIQSTSSYAGPPPQASLRAEGSVPMQPKRTSLLPVFATLLTLLVVGSFLGVFVVFPLLETNTFLKQAQDSLNRTHNTAADLVKAIDKIAQEDLQRDPSESTILSLTLPRKLTPPPDEKYTGTVAGTTDEPSELVLDPELETQVNLNENALKKLSKAKESLIDLKKLRLPEFLFFGAQDLKNDFDVYSDGFESLINYSEGVIMYNDLTVEVGITLENLGVGLDAAFATGDPVVIKREMDQLQIELRDLEGSLDKAKVPEDAVALHENGKEIISLLRSFFDSLNRAIETSDLELLEHAYNSFLVDMITIGKKTDDATKSFWRKTKFADDFQELEINKKTLEITIEAVQSNPIFKALRPFAY